MRWRQRRCAHSYQREVRSTSDSGCKAGPKRPLLALADGGDRRCSEHVFVALHESGYTAAIGGATDLLRLDRVEANPRK
jgi:hypothetical protein